MIHHKDSIHCRIAACILLLVQIVLFIPTVHAADEEIDIPYTDTYGYVYDPATGTFIKPDAPAATTNHSNTAPATGTSAPDTGNTAQSDTTTSTPPAQHTAATVPGKSWILPALVLLAIAAAIGYRLSGRKNAGPAEHTESRT